MDTKYFQQALEEMCDRKRNPMMPIHDLTIGELSQLLRRAQELKDLERSVRTAALGRMGL